MLTHLPVILCGHRQQPRFSPIKYAFVKFAHSRLQGQDYLSVVKGFVLEADEGEQSTEDAVIESMCVR